MERNPFRILLASSRPLYGRHTSAIWRCQLRQFVRKHQVHWIHNTRHIYMYFKIIINIKHSSRSTMSCERYNIQCIMLVILILTFGQYQEVTATHDYDVSCFRNTSNTISNLLFLHQRLFWGTYRHNSRINMYGTSSKKPSLLVTIFTRQYLLSRILDL